MAQTILYEGIDELEKIREKLVLVDSEKARVAELEKEQAVLIRETDMKKRDMNSEIEETVKKRKAELEFSYDREIEELNRGKKKVKNNRAKEKDEKKYEKVAVETTELYDRIRKLKLEIKSMIRDRKLPFFVGWDFFYAVFMPHSFLDVLIEILVFLILFVTGPYFLYSTLMDKMAGFGPMLVYVTDILIFGGAYIRINNHVKEKRRADISEIAKLRSEIKHTKDEIAKIKKGIRQSNDETGYGLEGYDRELADMDLRLRGLSDEQKEAMLNFDMETRAAITDEIKGRYEPEINAMKARYDAMLDEERRLKEHISMESLALSQTYEAQIGKSNMTAATINRLIAIIKEDRARTISEALIVDRADRLADRNGKKISGKVLRGIGTPSSQLNGKTTEETAPATASEPDEDAEAEKEWKKYELTEQ